MKKDTNQKLMTSWRWWMVVLLFVATTVNYMDRQVLSLTWKEFIAPEFHWTDSQYGIITSVFSIFYAVCMLFAGKFVDSPQGTSKKIAAAGFCIHAKTDSGFSSDLGGHIRFSLNSVESFQANSGGNIFVLSRSQHINPVRLSNASAHPHDKSCGFQLVQRTLHRHGTSGQSSSDCSHRETDKQDAVLVLLSI